MKSKEIGYLLMGGALIYFLTQQQRQPYLAPQYQQLPPAPPRSRAAEYQAWINLVLGTFGNVAALWQPGGPFYNSGINPNDVSANYTTTGWNNYSNVGRAPRIRGRTCRMLPGKRIYL